MCLWVVRQEFVTGLSVLARGTVQEKLLWAFSLYDTDGDGVITRDDLLDVVSGIYDLMGKYAEPSITPDTAQEHVDRVFQVIIATTRIRTTTTTTAIINSFVSSDLRSTV